MRCAGSIRPNGRGPKLAGGAKCPVCGSLFYPTREWGCLYGHEVVCSIPCMWAMRDRDRQRKLEALRNSESFAIWKRHRAGESVAELVRSEGLSRSKVYNALSYINDLWLEEALQLLREETA